VLDIRKVPRGYSISFLPSMIHNIWQKTESQRTSVHKATAWAQRPIVHRTFVTFKYS